MPTIYIIATLTITGWSLWVRRITWAARWEAGITTAIALYSVGFLTLAPLSAAMIGKPLRDLTGQPGIDAFLGHICIIAASAAMMHALLSRFAYQDFREKYWRMVVTPLILGVAVLLPLYFTAGVGATIRTPADPPTERLYWLILCGMVTYLFAYAVRALLVLRRHPKQRRIADLYLFAFTSGLCGCVLTLADEATPENVHLSLLVPVFAAGFLGGLGAAAGRSWREKANPFKALKTAVRV